MSAAEVAAEAGALRWWPRWVRRCRRRERTDAIGTYRRELAARAVHARRALVRSGVHLGPPPYGYRVGADRRLVPDGETARVVLQIFQWKAVDGRSPAEIARTLRSDPGAFRSPVRPDGMPSGWTARAVAAILANPRYTGRQVVISPHHRGSYDPGALTSTLVHPPLVPDWLWRLAQPAARPLPAELTPIDTRLATVSGHDAALPRTPDIADAP